MMRKRIFCWLYLAGFSLSNAALAMEPIVLKIDAQNVLREDADRVVGVNLDYLRDADANRPDARPLQSALDDMGARWLRYPGGEKSDFYLWAQPPYEKSQPIALSWYDTVPGARLDFDSYLAQARAVGAEPYLVVGYDSEKRSGRTKAQWLENAVSWVKYANITQKYGLKYWEIGNENWHNQTGSATELAQVVVEFSRAMKAIDPTIRIGASGNDDNWWKGFLPVAAPHLDFISLSLYNAWQWKSYDYWLRHPDADLIAPVRGALSAIDRYAPENDRARLKVVVAETNSKDYSESGWKDDNTLGHALVTFETLGQLMQQPRVLSALVWTTRWVKDEEAAHSQWYALGPHNEILPTGRAIALWKAAQPKMLAVTGANGSISAYASRNADNSKMTIWLVNRDTKAAQNIALSIDAPVAYRQSETWRFTGAGPDDSAPTWQQIDSVTLDGNRTNVSCPPVSVTVLSLRR